MWESVLEGNRWIALVSVILALLCMALGLAQDSERGYFSSAFALASGGCMLALFVRMDGERVFLLAVFFLSVIGLVYAPLSGILALRRRLRARRVRVFEEKRRLQYTLPDRENEYLRDRLRTALNPLSPPKEEGARVSLGYAKRMLARLKESPLSPLERIEIEETAAFVALLSKKEKWSGADAKSVNEVLSRLLKLAAKYELDAGKEWA